MKVMIIGAGGVGGYLAACLSHIYPDISVIARGEHLKAMRENGLTLIDMDERIITHPFCTDKPAEAGVQDAILFCTKSYDLADAVQQVRPCIGKDTMLIPLLNGISASRVIHEQAGNGIALDACIVVFSQITEPGVILKTGKANATTMGAPEGPAPEKLYVLRDMLRKAGVQADVSDNMKTAMWTKWIIMISNAQTVSYYDVNVGKMREDPTMFQMAINLREEALRIARAENVLLPDDIEERVNAAIQNAAYESQPSLLRDLNTPGKPTELDLFAGELCRLADKHGIDVPCNRMVLERYKDRV